MLFRSYDVSARDITLRSKSDLLIGGTKSRVNIHALGGGEVAENGMVSLQGTGQVVARSGPAMLGVRCKSMKGKVLANCGPLGSIELRRGLVTPPFTTRIKIADGINIEGGSMPVEITSMMGKILLNMDGIELEAPTIKLNATIGIEIGVAGNTLKFSPAGVDLDCLNAKIKSEVQTQIQALQVVQQSQAPSRAGAPIINLS